MQNLAGGLNKDYRISANWFDTQLVFNTLTFLASSVVNHLTKSAGYFSANSLQTLSKLITHQLRG